jgi:hypothetical protein
MLKRAVLFIFIIFCSTGQAQNLVLTNTIKGNFSLMTTDHIGKLYLTRRHELLMYSKDGALMYQFSDLSRGEITQLDTRNPLKLLVFYPGYSQIAFLDNTLSHTRENVELSKLGLELAQLACASYDNGFWVYDPVSFRLIRFDQGLNMTNEVFNVNQLVGGSINPNQMLEFDSWIYMNDPKQGIFVFDSFGTYSKLIPILGADRIQVRENGVFLQIGNRLVKYDQLNFEQTEIELPVNEFKAVSIEADRLFILQTDQVLIFSNEK